MRAVLLLLALAGAVSAAQWHRNGNNDLPNNWNVNEGKKQFAPDSLASRIMIDFTKALNSKMSEIQSLRWFENIFQGCDYLDCEFKPIDTCLKFVYTDLVEKMVYEIEWEYQSGEILQIDVYLSTADPKTNPTKWFLKIHYNTETKKITKIRNLVCKK
ncbi:hypothetical protein CAEBREN_17733 [Caenorhabditis brenneri]|uniref:DUF38 domain-containing protein n=1 Tax=Caenorhabditis brenneri TaxID=135651 RepID=G0M6X2_CAEBE|nr:hypothetical protein CAEBREN_17733 [Caenorhabditis brenneri]